MISGSTPPKNCWMRVCAWLYGESGWRSGVDAVASPMVMCCSCVNASRKPPTHTPTATQRAVGPTTTWLHPVIKRWKMPSSRLITFSFSGAFR